jgi:hypothetical protein
MIDKIGSHHVPSADSALNELTTQVVGNKTDTALTTPTATDSIMRYIKGLLGLSGTSEAVGPYSYLDAGGEQTIYESAVTTRRKISFDIDLNAMTQNGTIRLYRKVDGTNYRIWIEEPFNVGGSEKAFSREGVTINQHFKVTYEESADEGADRSIPYNVIIQAQE